MNRQTFASDGKLEKDIVPRPGQRWKLSLTVDEIEQKLLRVPPERRAMMSKFWESARTRGFVLLRKTDAGWMTHVNPKNPHPRSKEREIKEEWMKQYKFAGYD